MSKANEGKHKGLGGFRMSMSTATRATARLPRRSPGPPRPAIRVRPAPALEPPFDDERPPRAWAGPGAEQLALDLRAAARPGGPSADRRAAPASAGTASAGGASAGGASAGGASAGALSVSRASVSRASAAPASTARASTAPAPTGPSAETHTAVRRFIRLCLEIFNGYRPTGHVRAVTTPGQAASVIEQVGLARERVIALRRASGPGTPPAAGRRTLRPAEVVSLRHVQVCEPRSGVAEAAAVLHTAGRTWALAVRLESCRGRWLCTAARAV
jgi:hypothetical protein